MAMDKNDYMYRNLEYFRPDIFQRAVSIKKYNNWELILELDNGETVIYDDESRSVRKLPDDPSNLSDEELAKEFSIRLRNAIHRRRYTQEQFCNEIGITQAMLSRYLNGKAFPNFRVLDKMARVLDCSMDEFRCL